MNRRSSIDPITITTPASASALQPPSHPLPLDRSVSSPLVVSVSVPVMTAPGFQDLRTDQASSSASFSSLIGAPSALEQERMQVDFENVYITNLSIQNEQKEAERQSAAQQVKSSGVECVVPPSAFELGDLVGFFRTGMEVIVQDGFSRCFESTRSQPWNWNLYLWPLWAAGVCIRYGILFPIRVISLLLGLILGIATLTVLKNVPMNESTRSSLQRKLIRSLCGVFVFSWTGVIKYHGTLPAKKLGQIYVANHTSMIDVIVLSQMNTFSMVGQKHPGWVGFLQTHVLGIIGTVWFQRGEASDRVKSAKKMREHIHNPTSNRLLVFPEGTCVNNEYIVQFKQGVFDMDAEICPIAIKYNKIFVDAFWNSKAQSFQGHLATLMRSWAVVCDVYYLEPQRIMPGENGIAFSNRVKKLIADKIGLRNVSYDGYLKHFEVKQSLIEKQQKMYADIILKRLTQEEQAEIAAEEQREADERAAHIPTPTSQQVVSPAVTSAAPDTLAFSPSPDAAIVPATRSSLSRSSSGGRSGLQSTTSIPNISSSADLMALLDEVQAKERAEEEEAQKEEAQVKQRKVHPISNNNEQEVTA